MQGKVFFTYMLANGYRGWLYVGVTNDLVRRIDEHKAKLADAYTAEHGIDRLVWFEPHTFIDQAILREKRVKRWRREWKFALVEEANPQWLELGPDGLPARPSGVREDGQAWPRPRSTPLRGSVGDDKANHLQPRSGSPAA